MRTAGTKVITFYIELNNGVTDVIDYDVGWEALKFRGMQTGFASSASEKANKPEPARIRLAVATKEDRGEIYRIRHSVYAEELGQHVVNRAGRLREPLDNWNIYLVAKVRGAIAGFISVTPPDGPSYSIEKYVTRQSLPFPFDDALYEVRLLTVLKPHRGCDCAFLLMYAALRWIEAHGGRRIVAMGRREILDLYLRVGLKPIDVSIKSGVVTYDLLEASVPELRVKVPSFSRILGRVEEKTDWKFNFALRQPARCFHGGTFFKAVGEKFEALERSQTIINADVLDAWFPPSPCVLAALQEHLPWLLRTSPPTSCQGLIETVADVRGVAPENILPGSGSSDLIFRALRHWLTP